MKKTAILVPLAPLPVLAQQPIAQQPADQQPRFELADVHVSPTAFWFAPTLPSDPTAAPTLARPDPSRTFAPWRIVRTSPWTILRAIWGRPPVFSIPHRQ